MARKVVWQVAKRHVTQVGRAAQRREGAWGQRSSAKSRPYARLVGEMEGRRRYPRGRYDVMLFWWR